MGFFLIYIYKCMFKPIPQSNISIRPFKAYKNYLFNKADITPDVVRNLSGSFEDYGREIVSGSGNLYNEYALNKSIRSLFYNNHPRIVASVVNWNFGKYSNKQLYSYQVTSSTGLNTYGYYFDNVNQVYVDEFRNWLNLNRYDVNSKGEIFVGKYTDVTTMYGTMYNYGAIDERLIGNRYFVLQIPQLYIGEGINPGSLSIVDNYTGKTFIDDGYSNLTYSDNTNLVVGNVFYSSGIITITYKTETPTDENYYFGQNDFILRYQSTKTIYENEIFLEVLQNEFNVSTNPSATVYYNGATYVKSLIPPSVSGSSNGYDFRIAKSHTFTYDTIYGPAGTTKSNSVGFSDYDYSSSIDPTGSYLAPYITTIGLYDDYYELVAVAKIPSKPKSMSDYPINFIVRFDT